MASNTIAATDGSEMHIISNVCERSAIKFKREEFSKKLSTDKRSIYNIYI